MIVFRDPLDRAVAVCEDIAVASIFRRNACVALVATLLSAPPTRRKIVRSRECRFAVIIYVIRDPPDSAVAVCEVVPLRGG